MTRPAWNDGVAWDAYTHFTSTPNFWRDVLVKFLTPDEFMLLYYLWGQTHGYGDQAVAISQEEFVSGALSPQGTRLNRGTSLTPTGVARALRRLRPANVVIECTKGKGGRPRPGDPSRGSVLRVNRDSATINYAAFVPDSDYDQLLAYVAYVASGQLPRPASLEELSALEEALSRQCPAGQVPPDLEVAWTAPENPSTYNGVSPNPSKYNGVSAETPAPVEGFRGETPAPVEGFRGDFPQQNAGIDPPKETYVKEKVNERKGEGSAPAARTPPDHGSQKKGNGGPPVPSADGVPWEAWYARFDEATGLRYRERSGRDRKALEGLRVAYPCEEVIAFTLAKFGEWRRKGREVEHPLEWVKRDMDDQATVRAAREREAAERATADAALHAGQVERMAEWLHQVRGQEEALGPELARYGTTTDAQAVWHARSNQSPALRAEHWRAAIYIPPDREEGRLFGVLAFRDEADLARATREPRLKAKATVSLGLVDLQFTTRGTLDELLAGDGGAPQAPRDAPVDLVLSGGVTSG